MTYSIAPNGQKIRCGCTAVPVNNEVRIIFCDLHASAPALQAENERLREALKPFADCAEVWEDSDWARVIHWSRRNVDDKPDLKITVHDLMTARAALAKRGE